LLVGNYLTWSVGNGKQVRIGEDLWLGSGNAFKFPVSMINKLHNQGVFSLKEASIEDLDRIGRSDWKSVEMLELEGVEVDIWKTYVATLKIKFYSA
jgi:hypothetical protein